MLILVGLSPGGDPAGSGKMDKEFGSNIAPLADGDYEKALFHWYKRDVMEIQREGREESVRILDAEFFTLRTSSGVWR